MNDGHVQDMQRNLARIRMIYYRNDANPMLTLSYTTARESILGSLKRFRDMDRAYTETFFPNLARIQYGGSGPVKSDISAPDVTRPEEEL